MTLQRDAGPKLRCRAGQQNQAGPMQKGKEKPPLCKGGTAWRSHAGGIAKLIASERVLSIPLCQDCTNAPPGWRSASAPKLRSRPSAWAVILRSRAGQQNQPFLRHFARTAPKHLPVLARQHRSTEEQQRIPTGDRNGCPDTGPGAPRNRNAYSLGEFWERRYAADTPPQNCRCAGRETVV